MLTEEKYLSIYFINAVLFFNVAYSLKPSGQLLVINILIKITYLTSEPGGAVGLGRRSMYTQALAGQHVTVLGFLNQEAYLCQQTVQETWQHGCASDHHQVL